MVSFSTFRNKDISESCDLKIKTKTNERTSSV